MLDVELYQKQYLEIDQIKNYWHSLATFLQFKNNKALACCRDVIVS